MKTCRLQKGEVVAKKPSNPLYLTEERLVWILKDIFGESAVETQVKAPGRIIDAIVTLPLEKCWIPSVNELLDSQFTDDWEEDLPETITLYIEFDGHYHYTSNSQVSKDDWAPVWELIGCEELSLRIPYWVQLDREMTLLYFGVAKDYSNAFPHGFVSSKVVLPERFCYQGEVRLLNEMAALPLNVSLQVYQSLLTKAEKLGAMRVASKHLWYHLVKNFDQGPRLDVLNRLEEVNYENPHKNLDSKSLRFYLQDSVLRCNLSAASLASPIFMYRKEEEVFIFPKRKTPS